MPSELPIRITNKEQGPESFRDLKREVKKFSNRQSLFLVRNSTKQVLIWNVLKADCSVPRGLPIRIMNKEQGPESFRDLKSEVKKFSNRQSLPLPARQACSLFEIQLNKF